MQEQRNGERGGDLSRPARRRRNGYGGIRGVTGSTVGQGELLQPSVGQHHHRGRRPHHPGRGGAALGRVGPVTEGLLVWTLGLGLLIGIAVWLAAKAK